MTISTTKKLIGATLAAGVVFALAGCGQAPEASDSGDASKPVDSNFKPCIVSDDGGWNDRSFNQSAKEGLDKATKELGVKSVELQSDSADQYGPNLEQLVSQGCTFIVTVGFNLSADTIKSATANPDINYAIIDDSADADGDGKPDSDNIKPLLFDTVQAAYLGGYAAASWSHEAGVDKVGTFGGLQIPPVTIFMDGFVQGVAKFNEDKGADVKSVGWNVDTQKGSMTGGFAANDTAKQTAQSILDQGVDVLLPVGGPIYQSAAAAINAQNKGTVMMGVDSDLAVSDTSVADITLVSIQKKINEAVYSAVMEASKDKFDTTPYIGTLENGGVGLSSFHDFESKLPAGLADELKALQDKIVSGDIKVTSVSSPKA
ncbi:BMP family ABC transporter substrate-binding protein [Microbacterium sp. KUDC0406]|uniref:BMP family lipoprotein n=1 Tax=Microbacterium sp. KUDC0406 TaxID=2909588 RepID=UPI001F3E68F3|nr:BMP family ABC transporter substrate-binding protein [Microbacterium sp. KUDC0406]UJP10587.1 BMP family ABC transporter substrate-binding protein [Microbacterium sp. KUDC0406]